MATRGPQANYTVKPGPNDGGLRERKRTRIRKKDGSTVEYISYYTSFRDPDTGKQRRKDFGTDDPNNRTGMDQAIRKFKIFQDCQLGSEAVRDAVAVVMRVPALDSWIREAMIVENTTLVATGLKCGEERMDTPEDERVLKMMAWGRLADEYEFDVMHEFKSVPEHLKPLFVGMEPFRKTYREFCDKHGLKYSQEDPHPKAWPEHWVAYTDWVIERWIKNPKSDAEDRLRFPGLRGAARKGGFPSTDPCIRLDRIAEIFTTDRQAKRGIRRASVDQDVNAFKNFEVIVGRGQQGVRAIHQVTDEHVDKYWRDCKDYAPATQRKYFQAVRRVLDTVRKRLKGEDKEQVVRVIALLDDNLEVCKNGNGKTNGNGQQGPKKISKKEYKSLLKAADKRQRAMLLIAMNCAYYAIDLCRLPASALNLKSRKLYLPREKTGGTPRVAVLWQRTVKAIRDYQAAYPHKAIDSRTGERLLFANDQGRPLLVADAETTADWFYRRIFNPLRAKAGLSKSLVFSHLRDSAYTLAWDAVDKDTSKILCGQSIGISDHYIVKTAITKVGKACRAIERHYFGKPRLRTVKAS